ncbi:MAG: repeat protein [Planctomycetaceae bacterium]|nr:repeat protein [Planctomycetaceae bacterium]
MQQTTPDKTAAPAIDPTKIREVHSENLGRALLACRVDPSGKFVAAGGMNPQVSVTPLIDWKLGTPQHAVAHKGWVASLAFHPNGGQLFTADYTGLLCGWAFSGTLQTPLWSQPAHKSWIRTLAVSPDGSLVATGGNDNMVRCWSTADGKLVHELTGHDCHVYAVAFHPGGSHLVSADLRGGIRQWEVGSGRLVRELDVKFMYGEQGDLRLSGVRSLTFHPDGRLLACAGTRGFSGLGDGIGAATVTLLDWQTGQQHAVLIAKEPHRSFASAAAFHPAGYVLAATGGVDQGMFLAWKLGESETCAQVKLPQSAWGMDLHPDGRHLVVAHHDHLLRLYDLVPPAS